MQLIPTRKGKICWSVFIFIFVVFSPRVFDYLFERRTIKFDGYGGEETLGGAEGGGNVLSQYSVPKKISRIKKEREK